MLDRSLTIESLTKHNTSIKEINYKQVVDVSRKGMVDVYILEADLQRIKKWVLEASSNDKEFIPKMIEKGEEALNNLVALDYGLPSKVSSLSDEEVCSHLLKLKKTLFGFSGYFDFTIYLDQLSVKLYEESVERLSKFHDNRKVILLKFFRLFSSICKEVAKQKGVNFGSLDYLTNLEALSLLRSELSNAEADILQKPRKERYICKWLNGKPTVITKNFESELAKIEENLVKKEAVQELRGTPIILGKIQGIAKLVQSGTDMNTLPGKVVVAPMTSPEMTPFLEKAKAIVTDEGGLLCHAAVVAREFGVIAIVGTKNATKILKDGDLVEVDATKGIVRKLN